MRVIRRIAAYVKDEMDVQSFVKYRFRSPLSGV